MVMPAVGAGSRAVGPELLEQLLRSGKNIDAPTASVINQVLRSQDAGLARAAAQTPVRGAGRAALLGSIGSGLGLGANIAAPVIGELIAGNVGSSRDTALPGGQKYMITPADEANFLKAIFKENQNRRILNALPGGEDLPMLDADAMLQNARNEVLKSAAQAGERERAKAFGLANIEQEGLSQRQAMLGVQQGTQTAGTVLQEAIAKVLSDTPGTQDQSILVEVGRAV